MIYVNVGHIWDSISQETWQANLAAAKAIGFAGVRVTFSVDQYMLAVGGAVVSTPLHASQLGIRAFMSALLDSGLRCIFILSPTAPMSGSWGWPWPIQFRPPESSWHLIMPALQHMINTIVEISEAAGVDVSERYELELPKEWYWGGPGCTGATHGGALDQATEPLDEDYILEYGSDDTTAATDIERRGLLGIFDTDADWDDLADFTGKTGYADVRGRHEALQWIIPQLDLHGMRLIGSSMEADYDGTKLARSLATYAPEGITYPDGLPVNLHLYDSSIPASVKRHATLYGQWFLRAGALRLAQAWAALGRLPVYWTEFGFRPSWVWGSDEAGFRERERGQHWARMIEAMQRLPGVSALYTLRNRNETDDADFDFGVLDYAGNTSLGATAIAAQLGRRLDPSVDPPYGGAWLLGAGEPPAAPVDTDFEAWPSAYIDTEEPEWAPSAGTILDCLTDQSDATFITNNGAVEPAATLAVEEVTDEPLTLIEVVIRLRINASTAGVVVYVVDGEDALEPVESNGAMVDEADTWETHTVAYIPGPSTVLSNVTVRILDPLEATVIDVAWLQLNVEVAAVAEMPEF